MTDAEQEAAVAPAPEQSPEEEAPGPEPIKVQPEHHPLSPFQRASVVVCLGSGLAVSSSVASPLLDTWRVAEKGGIGGMVSSD